MLSRRTNKHHERARTTHPGLIAMAVAAVLAATLIPASHRIPDEACRIVIASSYPSLDSCLIGAADGVAADGAADIPNLGQPAERQ